MTYTITITWRNAKGGESTKTDRDWDQKAAEEKVAKYMKWPDLIKLEITVNKQ